MKFRYFLLITLLACGLCSAAVSTKNNDVAARVNDEVITMAEFSQAVQAAKDNLLKQGDIDFTTEEGKFILATTQRSILDDLINQRLIRQQAVKMNISVTDEDIRQEIAQLKKGFPSEKLFLETLAEENINETELKQGIRERLIIEKIKKALTKKIEVSDREIGGFLKQNKTFLNQPKRMQFKQILVGTRSEAEKVLERLKKGEQFATVAKEVSLDPMSKDAGGNIGFIETGVLSAEVESVVFALKEGELSPVLETDEGYMIFKCTQVLSSEDADSKQAVNEAKRYLLTRKMNEIFEKWFTKIKADAKVEINPEIEETTPVPQEIREVPSPISNGRV